jgi:D-alanyl-D-alanine carboxypeptidase/D-alanyl-D-alanine-endopeptidase (penicillin-binding protein 4)
MKNLIIASLLVSFYPLAAQFDFNENEICDLGFVGVSIMEANNGKEIYSLNANKSLNPASSLKVITSFAAYDKLGKDFRFETEVFHTGKLLSDGTLEGDILIKASGDPTFGSKRIYGENANEKVFEQISKAIKTAGITCIDGDLVLDISIFDDYPTGENWPSNDLGNYYAAGAWPLNFNENEYDLYFNTQAKIGEVPTIVSANPKIPGLRYYNRLTIDKSSSGDQAYIHNGPYVYNKTILGTLPQGHTQYKIRGAIPDPPRYFVKALYNYLAINNIGLNNHRLSKNSIKKATILTTFSSEQLSKIVKLTNEESINLYADALLFTMKSIGKENNIKDILTNYGVDIHGINLYDGCGLSPQTTISVKAITTFISKWIQKYSFDEAGSLLAEGGKEGTVKSMFNNHKIKGHIWIKSGSMQGVLSYSGMMKSLKGKEIVFSFILNNCEKQKSLQRAKVEEFLEEIYLSQ